MSSTGGDSRGIVRLGSVESILKNATRRRGETEGAEKRDFGIGRSKSKSKIRSKRRDARLRL